MRNSKLDGRNVFQNPPYARHTLTRPMQIEAPVPIKYASYITK